MSEELSRYKYTCCTVFGFAILLHCFITLQGRHVGLHCFLYAPLLIYFKINTVAFGQAETYIKKAYLNTIDARLTHYRFLKCILATYLDTFLRACLSREKCIVGYTLDIHTRGKIKQFNPEIFNSE